MDQGGVGFCIVRDGKHQQQPQKHLANLPISNISQHTQHISRESFHPALPFPPQPPTPNLHSSPQPAPSLGPVCVRLQNEAARARATPPTRETSRPAEEDAREQSSLGESIAGAVPLKQSRGRGSAGFPREWEMFRNGLRPPGAPNRTPRAVLLGHCLSSTNRPSPSKQRTSWNGRIEPTPVPAPA